MIDLNLGFTETTKIGFNVVNEKDGAPFRVVVRGNPTTDDAKGVADLARRGGALIRRPIALTDDTELPMKKDQSPRAGLVVAALLLGYDTIYPAKAKNAPKRRKAKGAAVPKPVRDRMNAQLSVNGAHA